MAKTPILVVSGGVDLGIVKGWETLSERKQGGDHAG